MTSAMEPFTLSAGFTSDLMVLEASAGTGKTFAISALSTLAVGRGDVRIGELCVATFTEAATAELRGRLRQRMADAVDFLDRRVTRPPADELEVLMDSLSAVDRDEWLERLRIAVRDFDTASITTIHGFCSRVVSAVAGVGTDGRLTADDSDVDEVVRDVLLGRLDRPDLHTFDHERVLEAVKLSLELPAAELGRIRDGHPGFDDTKAAHVERARLVDEAADVVGQCVAEVRARRRARNIRTFDDLLADTRDLLRSPEGEPVARELRRRYRVVLVDEFQDTDQVQWDIFRAAFLEPLDGVTPPKMVIVGDPKQSIYRFRAAELSAYLSARAYATERGGSVMSLTTNYRSDQPLLTALNALFADMRFGDDADEIVYFDVDSPDPEGVSALELDRSAVVQFRRPAGEKTTKPDIHAAIRPDLCDVVVDLLAGPKILDDGEWRDVEPKDIAILVNSNDEGLAIADALRERGVPAVASSSDSVLASEAARQWRVLLTALDRPSSSGAVRRATLSWFDGMTATELAALDDAVDDRDIAAVFDRYRRWSRSLIDEGLPALLSSLRMHGLSRRVLSRVGGERNLTDVEHLAELLQTRTGGRATTAGTLLSILDEMDRESGDERTKSEFFDRRIDRDDETVRIMTIHKAKGLEFGIVLVPSMWQSFKTDRKGVAHAAVDGVRHLDVDYVVGKMDGADFPWLHRASVAEQNWEDARKLYVALTRAKHRLVVWFPTSYTAAAANDSLVSLREMLVRRTGSTLVDFDPTPLVTASNGLIEFVDAPAAAHGRSRAPIEPTERELSVAEAPTIDRRWKRWSFTGFTRAIDDGSAAHSQPFVAGGFDEPSVGDEEPPELPVASDLPLRGIAGGRVFGSMVHEVLERADFSVADDALVSALRDECGRSMRYQSVRGVDPDRLAQGLAVALRAPLGGDLGDRALTHLTPGNRLNELGFDLPLARFDLAEIATIVLPHLDADDPFRSWFEIATHRHLAIEGVLNGSIDLIARTTIDDRVRYWLADYKTNVIADGIDFDHEDLVGEMQRDDYVLQSTLYQVALHRFLRWRLRDSYDPSTDLLGSAYLFVRGMDPSRPADDTRGVLWWRLPTPALLALDDLFATAGRGAA